MILSHLYMSTSLTLSSPLRSTTTPLNFHSAQLPLHSTSTPLKLRGMIGRVPHISRPTPTRLDSSFLSSNSLRLLFTESINSTDKPIQYPMSLFGHTTSKSSPIVVFTSAELTYAPIQIDAQNPVSRMTPSEELGDEAVRSRMVLPHRDGKYADLKLHP